MGLGALVDESGFVFGHLRGVLTGGALVQRTELPRPVPTQQPGEQPPHHNARDHQADQSQRHRREQPDTADGERGTAWVLLLGRHAEVVAGGLAQSSGRTGVTRMGGAEVHRRDDPRARETRGDNRKISRPRFYSDVMTGVNH